MLILVIILSILSALLLVTALLVWFVKKVLRGSNRRLSRIIVGLLILQFILGMLSNLFVQIPKVEPWLLFHQFGPILLHSVNALCLLIFSIIFLVQERKLRRNAKLAIVGTASIVLAFASGVVFVTAGQNNTFSFAMALGFITAFMVYGHISFTPGSKSK